MKRTILILVLFLCVLGIISLFLNTSFAYSYDIDNSVLFYKDDYVQLEKDVTIYLEQIDEYVITNSSFLYSDKLYNNYDFLVNFALDYILDNLEYYHDDVISGNQCNYINKYGVNNYTFNYVDINLIYEITDKYFGVRDFSVINDNVCIKDNYISLSDYSVNNFDFDIIDIEIKDNGNNILVNVIYDSGDNFIYSFYNDNGIMKLDNVEVV